MTRYDKYGEPLDGPTTRGCEHTCNATEYGRCWCDCHDDDECGCPCCDDVDWCDLHDDDERNCPCCDDNADPEPESVSEVEIEAALVAVCDANRRFLTDGTFSIPLDRKSTV